MKCLTKIHHPYLTYSFFALAFSLFLCVVGSVSDSYATSGTCTLTYNDGGGSSTSKYRSFNQTLNSCNIPQGSYVALTSYYFEIVSPSMGNITFRVSPFSNTAPIYFHTLTVNTSSGGSYSGTLSNPVYIPFFYYNDSSYSSYSNVYVYFSTGSSFSSGWKFNNASFVFTWNDDLGNCPTCPEPEEPEPCPPIPENPYDDKLDEIKKAIYCASAVMIMIYFFFIVYKIIVKDGGRR